MAVDLKIGADTSGLVSALDAANAALAKSEKATESLKNKLQHMQTTAAKPVKVNIDSMAAKMTGGSSGDGGIAARMAAAGQQQARSMQASQRLADAPAIMQTRSVIAQVRAQQAAREATFKQTQELAKQPGLIDSAGGAAMRYLGPLALAGAAVKVISAEWQNVIDRQQKSGVNVLTFEQALIESAPGMTAETPEWLAQQSKDIAKETGAKPETVVPAVVSALKSAGARTPEDAKKYAEAAREAARIFPTVGSDKLGMISGAISSNMQLTGTSAKEAAGDLEMIAARTNMGGSVESITTASNTVSNMALQGASRNLRGSLMPSVSQFLQDDTGEQSSMASIIFTQSLKEQFGEQFKGQKNVPDLAMDFMRKNPEEARKFWSGKREDADGKAFGVPEVGRGRARVAFRALTGDIPKEELAVDPEQAAAIKEFMDQYSDFYNATSTKEEAGKFHDKASKRIRDATPHQSQKMAHDTATTRLAKLGDDAEKGIGRQGLEENLQAAGFGWLNRKIKMAEVNWMGVSEEKMLRSASGELKSDAVYASGSEKEKLTDAAGILRDAAEELRRVSETKNINRNGNVEQLNN